jgi:isopenicillin N synthase-like dioxygenase
VTLAAHSDAHLVDELATIDIEPLVRGDAGTTDVALQLDRACRELGFFRVVGHGIDPALFDRMDRYARQFFDQPDVVKEHVAMRHAGAAWRGWFPVGGEITSGRPDRKEGLYVGAELPNDDPRVVAGTPLHGANLFPPGELGHAVRAWLDAITPVAAALVRGIALGLGLPATWFDDHLTADPTVLFRIFHYPPIPDDASASEWSVGEHTDYGLLTLLAQDGTGGLQVRTPAGTWIDVPADRGVIVCNIGDMLDKLTEGRYRSTPHRVRNVSGVGRLSFPFFFDPAWDAVVVPLPLADTPPADDAARRWDGASLRAWTGTYGDYLSAKVARVFPDLFAAVAPDHGERVTAAEG